MLSMPFASAPAGVLGMGGVDARPHARAAVRSWLPAAGSAVCGTGAPLAGLTRRRGTALMGTALMGTALMGTALMGTALMGIGCPAALPLVEQQIAFITQNDGITPLGIHSPGRSTS
jgi:hypothetical protein